jgi:hypothetical protein
MSTLQTHTAAEATLQLTPEVNRIADALCNAVDAFDWEQIEEADCDSFVARYSTQESLETATSLWIQLVALDQVLVDSVVSELRSIFRALSNLRVENGRPGHDSGSSIAEATSILQQLQSLETDEQLLDAAHSGPVKFAQEWKRLWKLLDRLDSLRLDGVEFAQEKSSNAVPLCWPNLSGRLLGASSQLQMRVPLRLVLSGSILLIARRICDVNTEITSLPISKHENSAVLLHSMLSFECEAECYKIEMCQDDDPNVYEIAQEFTNFVNLFSEFIKTFRAHSIRQDNRTKLLQRPTKTENPPGPPIPQASKSQGKRTPITPKSSDYMPTSGAKARGTIPKLSERAVQGPIRVRVNAAGLAHAEGITGKQSARLRRAILYIALHSGNGGKTVELKTADYIEACYYPGADVNKTWHKDKSALTGAGFFVDPLVRDGEYIISNYLSTWEEGATEYKTRQRLEQSRGGKPSSKHQ